MAKQVVLLRVGIDAGCGGMQGPLFDGDGFELICIPDEKGVSADTYGQLSGSNGKKWINYFPESTRKRMERKPVHLDPEFKTFTYGDPGAPKRSLAGLRAGDYLAFYCGLQRWDPQSGFQTDQRPALYLIGYFEVALAGMASQFAESILRREFANNFHCKYRHCLNESVNKLFLVKGGPGSRLFRKAHLISEEGKDKGGRPLKILQRKRQKVFGTFGGLNSLQRSTPRWVQPDLVKKAIGFLQSLE